MDVSTGRTDAEAAEFVERCHRALRQHTSGNPRPYLELWSDADDVSLMGGVGGHQVGLVRRAGGELQIRDVDSRLPHTIIENDAHQIGEGVRSVARAADGAAV